VNLRNIEIFCDIATHRSFSKAALVRQVSQPAVSQALQQLEEELGVTLVDRSQRPIDLTAAGSVYLQRCQKWLEEYREIEDLVRRFDGKLAGRVRLASIYSVGLLQMSGYVHSYTQEYPDVQVALDYAPPDEIYRRVLRDEVDFGIVSFPREGGEIGCIPWQNQEMVLATAPGHHLAERGAVVVRELQGENFVGFTADLMICRKTEKLLKKSDVSVNVVHQFDNVETVKRAVEIDLGMAILPLETMRREIEFGTLHAVRLADVEFFRPLGVVHKRHKHLSRAAEKFVERLREAPADANRMESQPLASTA
jgi:DNA-binding transcriptional LysR family regulator